MFSRLEKLLPKRIAFRMALTYALLTACIMGATFAITLYRVNRYFYDDIRHELVHEAHEIATLIGMLDADFEKIETLLNKSGNVLKNTFSDMSVRRAGGPIILHSGKLISSSLIDGAEYIPIGELTANRTVVTRFEGHHHNGQYAAFLAEPRPGERFECIVAIYPRLTVKSITNIKYVLLWILLCAIVLFTFLGLYSSARTYLPVRKMIEKARRISEGALDLRLEGTGRLDELTQLADALNALFDHIQKSLDRERDFNALAAHELRTPLTSLRGEIERLLLDESLTPKQRDGLASAISATDRLVHLVNSMLFLSRAESGGDLGLKQESVSLKEVVTKACDLIFPSEDKETPLSVDIPESMVLRGDRELLLRLSVNLIGNAKRHTPPGTPISIRARADGERICLRVQDRGGGIPEVEKKKIFDRFFSRSRQGSTGSSQGAGLGLRIAQAIAKLHGGAIRYEDTPGGGATFLLELPL